MTIFAVGGGKKVKRQGSRGVEMEGDRRAQEGKVEGPLALSEECCPCRCSTERAS